MKHWKLTKWCTEAVTKIKYPPDRRAVYDELRQHMDDRCEDFLEQGLSKEEAVDKVVNVMGDPHELAVQLAAIHRPFWGFACSITKGLMRIMAIVALISILITGYRFFHVKTTGVRTDDAFRNSIPAHDRTRLFYAEPNCSDSSDGYTFTAKRVAIQQNVHDLQNGNQYFTYNLFIEVEVTKPHLWAANCFGIDAFWGVDNLGKRYLYNGYNVSNEYLSCSTYDSKNYFTQYYNFSISYINYNPAEKLTWIELHYDRDGRDVVLHIDLTGGTTV